MGLAKQFALTYATFGVRVNAVCPDDIKTPMIAGITSVDAGPAFLESLHPMGRLGQPEEIAAADASFITGVALPGDGGYSAR